jgi:glutathione synthase/RimK-type ligase-like ATP-grasp enzyme
MEPFMQIAIHRSSGSFSDRWIEECDRRGISFRIVNCRASDIVGQLKGCSALLWHWSQGCPGDKLVANQVIAAVERLGLEVFPNATTSAHFDDKIAQKYLLEAVGAPLIPTHVLLDEAAALAWTEQAHYPLVFKLRCGAGSANVRLVKTPGEARRLCKRMFSRGMPSITGGYFSDMRARGRRIHSTRQFIEKAKRSWTSIRGIAVMRQMLPRQKGYALFQDFMAGNEFDTRVAVIGRRAFAFLRQNRPGDFRASGSGRIIYDPDRIDRRCLRIALDTSPKIGAQSMAYDFVYDEKKEPGIVEISYGYMPQAVYDCGGYWDQDLTWHEGHFWPEALILDDVLAAVEMRRGKATRRTSPNHVP